MKSTTGKVGVVISDIPPSISGALIKLSDRSVRPLEYLVAYFEREGRKFGAVLRVTDVRHVSEYSRARTIEIEEKLGVRAYPELIQDDLIGEYIEAVTELIDCFIVRAGDIHPIGPVVPPPPRAEVYKADKRVMNILVGKVKNPLYIGHLHGSPTRVELEANNLIRHMIILGGTGTGKSWFRGVLMEELHKMGVLQVNLDILDEYTQATEQLGGVNITLKKDYKPRLDVFSPDEFDQLIEDYVPTPFQRTIARQGYVKFRDMSRRALTPLTPKDLLRFVDIAADEYNAREDTRQNTISRLEAFIQDFGIFGESIDWKMLTRKYRLVNIRFPYMADQVIRAGIAAVLKELMSLRNYGAIDPLVISFDEAHTIIPRGRKSPAATVVRHLLRYGRHIGIGIIMITQRPSSIDDEAVNMPATRVIFATDPAELKGLKTLLSDLGDYALNLIPRLEAGTAVITGTRDILRHSLYVSIRSNRNTTHGGRSIPLVPDGD